MIAANDSIADIAIITNVHRLNGGEMRFRLVLFATLAFMVTGQSTNAIMVYPVSHSFLANSGGAGTIDINGTITTDGTLGAIGSGNVTAWSLTFSNSGGTQPNFVMTEANSDFDVSGGASLTATATALDFNIPVPAPFGFPFPQLTFFDTLAGPDIAWTYEADNFGTAELRTRVRLDTDGNGVLPDTLHLTTVNPMTSAFTGDLVGSGMASVPEPPAFLSAGLIAGLSGVCSCVRRQRLAR